MYVKKNQQSVAQKDPLLGVLTIFKQALIFDEMLSSKMRTLRTAPSHLKSDKYISFLSDFRMNALEAGNPSTR